MNRNFFKENTNSQQILEKMLIIIIREKQIKTTRYHFTPIRMAKINNTINNRCWQGCREKGALLYFWQTCNMVQPLQKTVWRFPKELKIQLPYDPAIAFLGIYPQNTKALIQRVTCTPMFMAAFTIVKIWKKIKCPLYPSIDEWRRKL